MPIKNKKLFFDDFVFYIHENVYEPSDDTFFFANNLNVKEKERVLDLGTGCGFLGLIAAKKASKVIAVDINPFAVHCAKTNAKLNGLSNKIFFVQGDLFSSIKIGTLFELILFNPPYLPIESKDCFSWIDFAWAGGLNGRQVTQRFINEAPKYLEKHGKILLLQSSLSDIKATLRNFEKNNLKASIIGKKRLPFFETIMIYKAEHKLNE
jgi:release factor glutamine methyltransferase